MGHDELTVDDHASFVGRFLDAVGLQRAVPDGFLDRADPRTGPAQRGG